MAPGKSKTARYTEIERKFAVTETTVSPSFEGLSAVTEVARTEIQRLDAVYFDTPDRGLAAHRITLRRRTGGNDAGWHLKLPAGVDTRTEVRTPLGAATDTVPEDLRDIVLAIVRDRPLSPVARISTQRSVEVLRGADGIGLAEFCDDRVTASTTGGEADQQSWREWELELLTADVPDDLMDRLSNRLADAGAVPAGHGSKLAKVLGTDQLPAPTPPADPVHRAIAEQIEALLLWDRAVRADAYDSVHQLRVTTRKIRSLLQESRDSFGLDDDNVWVLDELRALAAVLGVARDAEVLGERYQRALDEMPAELIRGPVRQRLVEGANRRYTAGWRRSLLAMRSPRYFRLLDALEELVSTEKPESADASAPSVTIDAAYKRVRKAAKTAKAVAAEEASTEEKDEALHRIRKGAKRLRYTAAATGADKVSDRAKYIQTLLGDHQDSVVSKAHLSTQADAAHAAGEDTFTYGLLYQREHDTAQQSRALLDDALKKLDKAVRKTH